MRKKNYRVQSLHPNIMKTKVRPADEGEWRECFGAKLYQIMCEKDISLEELGILSGISSNTISMYVNGRTTPTGYRLLQIAKALNCSLDELIDI